jgi:hypothetical protein
LKSEDVPSGAACKVEDLDRQGRDVRRERPAEGVEISLESGNEQPLVGETAEEGDRGREQMVLSTHNVQIVH